VDSKGQPESRGDERRTNARRAALFALLTMLFLFAFTHPRIQGQNDWSRFVAVESLLRDGTLNIDKWLERQPNHGKSADGVYLLNDMVINRVDGHFYSSKPPVYTLILAGVMFPFKALGADPNVARLGLSPAPAVFVLTWLVVGAASACAFYFFRRKVGECLGGGEADMVTVLTLGGTLFLSYSVTMNHHTFTAALVLISFFLLGMAEASPRVKDGGAAAAGFLMGLAAVVDIGTGVAFAIGFGLYIIFYLRSLRTLIVFGFWSIGPLATHCIVQYMTFHSILPVQLIRGTKDYAGSYWSHKVGPDTWQIPRSYYWLLTLFSARGLFVLSPILLVGAAALAGDVRQGLRLWGADRAQAGRGYVALAVLFGILFLFVYYAFKAPTNFCGSCFGFRWYIGFTPLLAFYAARGYVWCRAKPGRRKVFHVLGAISVIYALIGMQAPWLLMESNPLPPVRVLMLLRGF
jgi:hypothetical protein